MAKNYKSQAECDVDHALGTLRQMAFFDFFRAAGMTQETCVQVLMEAFSLPYEKANPLLFRIGRHWNHERIAPSDFKAYLIEKGKPLLAL